MLPARVQYAVLHRAKCDKCLAMYVASTAHVYVPMQNGRILLYGTMLRMARV